MTPNELLNKRLAIWMGLKNLGSSWAEIHNGGKTPIPDFYNSNAAFDLLDVLVERGYLPKIYYNKIANKWSVEIWCSEAHGFDISKSAAICEAICRLIEEEGKL